jgi:hypothetical protein
MVKIDIDTAYDEMIHKKEKRESEIATLEKRINTFNKITWFFVSIGFIIVAFGCYKFYFTEFVANTFKLNELGDFYAGSVASAWSLAGLLFIYIAFLGQKQQMIYQQIELSNNHYEIQVTREDIKNQTAQLEGQKEQMLIQNESTKKQQFETTFFNLFNTYHQICSSMSHSVSGMRGDLITLSGKKVLSQYERGFNGSLSSSIDAKNLNKHTIDLLTFQNSYWRFYDNNSINLSQYFSSIESILLHIYSYYPDQNDNFFAQILKNQFLEQELVLIFYHGLGINTAFKKLIESFDMLNKLDILNTRTYSLVKEYESIKLKYDVLVENEKSVGYDHDH